MVIYTKHFVNLNYTSVMADDDVEALKRVPKTEKCSCVMLKMIVCHLL